MTVRRQLRILVTGVALSSATAGLALSLPGPADAAAHKPHRTPWHVTIKADTTELTLGQRVHLTGKVAKSASGQLVKLYERGSADQPWRYQRNALVHKNGHYATYDKPTVNSSRQYRVVMPGTQRHKQGASEAVIVEVFRWTTLTTLPDVNDVDLDPTPSVSMNGVSYPSSLVASIFHFPGAPTAQAVEFNLGHRCTRFRGTFGLSDNSVTGAQATVTATADGTPWFNHTYGLGESDANEFTFETPPLKIRFDSVSVVDGLDGLGAVGTPEVYCQR
jgi:hypothetical protein